MIIVPISAKRQREIFTTKSYTFNAKPAGKKRDFPRHHISHSLPAVLPPVGRCAASQGGGGVRIPPRPIWARVGELFGAPKAKQEKGAASWTPRPGHFCPQCGQLRRSTSGVVEGNFWRAVGSKTEMIPQLREKLRGRGKISRRKMK